MWFKHYKLTSVIRCAVHKLTNCLILVVKNIKIYVKRSLALTVKCNK